MNPRQIIACLNSVGVGELDLIRAKLVEAREACLQLDQTTLADQLVEADRALVCADLKTYRRRVETVISQLGHLK